MSRPEPLREGAAIVFDFLMSLGTAEGLGMASVLGHGIREYDAGVGETPPGPLDALRALSDAATPGPWRVRGKTIWCGPEADPNFVGQVRGNNAALIVAAVNYVRAALTPASPSPRIEVTAGAPEAPRVRLIPPSPSEPPGLDATGEAWWTHPNFREDPNQRQGS